jgi:hypothetical protein
MTRDTCNPDIIGTDNVFRKSLEPSCSPPIINVLPFNVITPQRDDVESFFGSIPGATPPFPANCPPDDERNALPLDQFLNVQMPLHDENHVMTLENIENILVVDDDPVSRSSVGAAAGGGIKGCQ